MTLIIAFLLALPILLTLCFAVEVAFGIKPLPTTSRPIGTGFDALVVIPAHNEEPGIAEVLRSLEAAQGPGVRILVVADNCTDATASIARAKSVEVIERHDVTHHGKGFALDFARQHVEGAPPEVVVIIDADCSIDRGSLERLISCSAATGRPCQATYLLSATSKTSPAVELSTFAFYIKNVVRQRALARLAGRAHLLGTGMAFPWAIYARGDLATSNIVEDLALGQELAQEGHAPLFVEDANVWGRAETDVNTLSQRERWEGGFLQNALRNGPIYLLRSIVTLNLQGMWAAINLMIPPIAFLVLLDSVGLLVGLTATWLGDASIVPVLILASTLVAAALGLLVTWQAGGKRFISASSLARVPSYVLWKLPMYFRFIRSGAPKEWVRTSRGDD